jgi:hypothetical protein
MPRALILIILSMLQLFAVLRGRTYKTQALPRRLLLVPYLVLPSLVLITCSVVAPLL